MERLDKVIASSGAASRKEVRALLREGRVNINGAAASRFDEKVEDGDVITIDGKALERFHYAALVMNKPCGYVTSTDDRDGRSVMELLPPRFLRLKVKPVGRLDKDTSGLLLFTNDGALLHSLISPGRNVEKEYIVTHKGRITPEIIKAFEEGVVLSDGTVCRKAVLLPLENGRASLTITEGKYHQVRRMMGAFGLDVTALKRVREGRITLSGLEEGEVKELSPDIVKDSVDGYNQEDNLI